jgi:glutaredoxin
MTVKRKIAVFSAGCVICEDAVKLVNSLACPSCEVNVLDMHDPDVAKWSRILGIRSVPAIVIDGKLADCCTGRGIDEVTLKVEGLGKSD